MHLLMDSFPINSGSFSIILFKTETYVKFKKVLLVAASISEAYFCCNLAGKESIDGGMSLEVNVEEFPLPIRTIVFTW